VPKKYVEKVGDEGYKKAPVGAGPYRFVSFTPGVELVLEAFEPYWRRTPHIKRLLFRVVPDDATRLAMLKRGEIDIVYSLRGYPNGFDGGDYFVDISYGSVGEAIVNDWKAVVFACS
jgi:ABC-type transport system substrate-binding protein